MSGRIFRISGAMVIATGLREAFLNEMVEIGREKIPGEVIRLSGDQCFIQSFEETGGLTVGEPVVPTGRPLSVTLGPGILGRIFDGVQRPLPGLEELQGPFILRGGSPPVIDTHRLWAFTPSVAVGDQVLGGDIIGHVRETDHFDHAIMVPIGSGGRIISIKKGDFTVEDTVAELDDGTCVTMLFRQAVKIPFPHSGKTDPEQPFYTGQRVLDFLFPTAMGGSAMIPGGFGTGKTVLEQSIAKHSLADVVVYIGCGERGNEMTDLLCEFAELKDPRTGGMLLSRTVLIANTSNMPVAAREASIYTGVAIGEYFRQMGLNVALIADSTTRWAEALREISGRLEELPGEEGFPTYLSSRISAFYERAGCVRCAGSQDRTGSLTIVGAVSPAGGDFSEPVTSETLKITGTFWGLERALAYRRHFPAINWNTSYSLYVPLLEAWFEKGFGPKWGELRNWAVEILFRDGELQQIVQLVGPDALQNRDRLILDTAYLIKESFLQQSAYDEKDACCPLPRQLLMMEAYHRYYQKGLTSLKTEKAFDRILDLPERRGLSEINTFTDEQLEALTGGEGE